MSTPAESAPWRGVSPPDQRLPDTTRLGGVALQVSDLDRSLAFYQGAIGLRLLARSDDRADLGSHGDGRTLLELHRNPSTRPIAPGSRLGLYHVALLLPERAALGRFVRHLAELGLRAGAADHLVSEALYFTDPDGLGLEVYADRPRSGWTRRGDEIAMTSEPLDLEDLMRAGGGAAWQGVPAGSAIGHIHLYVNDLERAATFYHRGLGLDIAVGSYPDALFLAAGGYHHHLGLNTWARGARPAEADDPRLLWWEMVLPDEAAVEAAAASLEGAGVEVATDRAKRRAVDPWGTPLRLLAETAS